MHAVLVEVVQKIGLLRLKDGTIFKIEVLKSLPTALYIAMHSMYN